MHSTNACRQAGAHVGSPHTASLDANRARLGSTTTPFVVDALFDIPTALDPQDDPGADSADSSIGAPGSTREEWVEQAKELLAGKPPRAKADQAELASGKDY